MDWHTFRNSPEARPLFKGLDCWQTAAVGSGLTGPRTHRLSLEEQDYSIKQIKAGEARTPQPLTLLQPSGKAYT